jgi:hypothetical protein
MKKLSCLFLCCCVSVVFQSAFADLAIDWKNTTKAVYQPGGSGGSGPFVTNGMIQLIWSASGITTTSGNGYDLEGGTLLPGEYLLATAYTTPLYGFWSAISDIYVNTDVGGANINSGYFFTRIFQNSTASLGAYFVDVGQVNAASWVYSYGPPPDPATVYNTGSLSANVTINQNLTTVIPEPATMGLFGLGAIGTFLIRRKKKLAA